MPILTYTAKYLTQGHSPPSRWSKDSKQGLHLLLRSIHEQPRATGVLGGVSENGALSLSTSSPWKSKVQQMHLLIDSPNIYALNIYHVVAMVLGAEKIVGNKIFLGHKEFSFKMTESKNKPGMTFNVYGECGQFSPRSLLPPQFKLPPSLT